MLNQQQKLKDDEAGIVVRIDNEKENQRILKTGMDSSKETMDQLLELHRLALEKNVKPTLGQQDALAESQTLYLANQEQFQQANDQITVLTGQQRQLQRKIDEVTEKIEPILLTVEQVALQLSVSSKTVSRLINNNEFQFIRIGRSIRIPKGELFNYVERNKRYNYECEGSDVQEKST